MPYGYKRYLNIKSTDIEYEIKKVIEDAIIAVKESFGVDIPIKNCRWKFNINDEKIIYNKEPYYWIHGKAFDKECNWISDLRIEEIKTLFMYIYIQLLKFLLNQHHL